MLRFMQSAPHPVRSAGARLRLAGGREGVSASVSDADEAPPGDGAAGAGDGAGARGQSHVSTSSRGILRGLGSSGHTP